MWQACKIFPAEVEEAAQIDGASTWQVIHYIIVPLLGPDDSAYGLSFGVGIAANLRSDLGDDAGRTG